MSRNSTDSSPLTSDQRQIIICVSLASFMCLLDSYIVNISLPEIGRHFGVTAGEVVRINLAFLLVLTSGLSVWGKLADRIGLKRIFLSGYLIFTISSTLCGFAPSLFWLTAGRGLQGLGAAMLIVSGPAFIARDIPAARQGSAYGIQGSSSSLGLIIGAPLGGIISGHLGWQYIFLVNIPIGTAACLLAASVLPPDPQAKMESREKFDIPGALLLIGGLLLLVSGINSGTQGNWESASHWLMPLAGVVILALLWLWQKRCHSPLLPLDALGDKTFLLMTLAYTVVLMMLSGNNFAMPFYLARELHLSPSASGFLMLFFSCTYGLLSLYMGRRADRFNPSLLCMTGMAWGLLSCLVFTFFLDRASTVLTAVFLISMGFALGSFIAPATKLVMGRAARNNVASVSALFRTFIYLASLIGVSLFDLLLGSNGKVMEINNFQRTYLAAALLPLLALFFSWRVWRLNKEDHERN
ncbi:MAG: MFS transporter [Proteobacteria bacterium]|nr:MFS transporter [Pseudomonadota bacterium]MBU1232038.1 MFS transporter [Pseudomonadota bacterium]MBU1417286.1 MFS transporter [Pseudomonadota bacterium]MBU1453971.1 MFS transporter [Pseudomonadota bacterium]